jgi:hypothetical protein
MQPAKSEQAKVVKARLQRKQLKKLKRKRKMLSLDAFAAMLLRIRTINVL